MHQPAAADPARIDCRLEQPGDAGAVPSAWIERQLRMQN
jgi:hypothetical protein